MKKRQLLIVTLTVIIIALAYYSFSSYSQIKTYEEALIEEITNELEQRQVIMLHIMKDMLKEDNSYQKIESIRSHLRDFENDTILPNEVDRFFSEVILVSLDGYANGFNDEKREKHIKIFTEAVIEFGTFNERVESIILKETFNDDSGMQLKFLLDTSEYKLLVDSNDEGYGKLNEYFRSINEKYISDIKSIESK